MPGERQRDDTDELIARLRARLTTTNRPPAPVADDAGRSGRAQRRHPPSAGHLPSDVEPRGVVACLDMYKNASFPLGTKKRIEGLRLVATDVDWAHGTDPR